MTATTLIFLAVVSISAVATQKIPLTKCCLQSQSYKIGYDSCADSAAIPAARLPLPVHSVTSNTTIYSGGQLEFRVTVNKTKCPDGFVAKSSTEFQFFKDGSMRTADGIGFDSGAFCLDQVLDKMNETRAEMVARFCVRQETHCIRKCCPTGMAMNLQSKLCERHSSLTRPVIRAENGTVLDAGDKMKICDGLIPDCPHGINPLFPALNERDQFYILPDGQLYAVHFSAEYRKTDEYCVDTFFSNSLSEVNALTCFADTDNKIDQVALDIYACVLLFTSVCLIVAYVVYAVKLPELGNVHRLTIMCQVSDLAVMCFVKAVLLLHRQLNDRSCIAFTSIFHFLTLSSFTWLNVMSYDVWWTTKVNSELRTSLRLGPRFAFYSLYALGLPFLIVLTGQLVGSEKVPDYNIEPGFGVLIFWFSDFRAHFGYLYVPFIVLIIVNATFFILTALKLHQTGVGNGFLTNTDAAIPANSTHAQHTRRFRVILILFALNLAIVGGSWTLEGLSFAFGGSAFLWLMTYSLNFASGLLILVVLVGHKKMWRLLKRCSSSSSPSQPAQDAEIELKMKNDEGEEVNQSTPMLGFDEIVNSIPKNEPDRKKSVAIGFEGLNAEVLNS